MRKVLLHLLEQNVPRYIKNDFMNYNKKDYLLAFKVAEVAIESNINFIIKMITLNFLNCNCP